MVIADVENAEFHFCLKARKLAAVAAMGLFIRCRGGFQTRPYAVSAAGRAAAIDDRFHSHKRRPTPSARPAASSASAAPLHLGRSSIKDAESKREHFHHASGGKRCPAQAAQRKNTPIDAAATERIISEAVPIRISAGWKAKTNGTI